MSASIDIWTQAIHQGDAAETLAAMPESSVHMAMCSPPFWGLRDYDVDGQIGLESSLSEYVAALVAVGDELRRVLRPDGSWWLNLGDTYSGGGGITGKPDDWDDLHEDDTYPADPPARSTDFGPKNKLLVPHRVAIALQDAGWVVRSDAVWSKPNGVPDSARDRLREDKEFIFHLTPEPHYWFDLDDIREPHADISVVREEYGFSGSKQYDHDRFPGRDRQSRLHNFSENALHPRGKNPGDVFEIPVFAYPEAHFAVYPAELPKLPIKASCPPEVCADCGAPYDRKLSEDQTEMLGWESTCDCETAETLAGISIDPFVGAGTTNLVAKKLGRRFIGIDLNEEYVAMAQRRVGITVDRPELLNDDDQTGITAYADRS